MGDFIVIGPALPPAKVLFTRHDTGEPKEPGHYSCQFPGCEWTVSDAPWQSPYNHARVVHQRGAKVVRQVIRKRPRKKSDAEIKQTAKERYRRYYHNRCSTKEVGCFFTVALPLRTSPSSPTADGHAQDSLTVDDVCLCRHHQRGVIRQKLKVRGRKHV